MPDPALSLKQASPATAMEGLIIKAARPLFLKRTRLTSLPKVGVVGSFSYCCFLDLTVLLGSRSAIRYSE